MPAFSWRNIFRKPSDETLHEEVESDSSSSGSNESTKLLDEASEETPPHPASKLSQEFKTAGIAKMIVAVIGFIGFMVYAIVVRHSLHGTGIFLYLGILGAVMFGIAGGVAISISKLPTRSKIIFGLVLASINIVFDLVLTGFAVKYLTSHPDTDRFETEKKADSKFPLLVGWFLYIIIKTVLNFIFVFLLARKEHFEKLD